MYLHACETLRKKPEECVAIEDSKSGTLSAVRAGIPVMGYVGSYLPERQEEMKQQLLDVGAKNLMTDWKGFRERSWPSLRRMTAKKRKARPLRARLLMSKRRRPRSTWLRRKHRAVHRCSRFRPRIRLRLFVAVKRTQELGWCSSCMRTEEH
jgi:hypothetical protein